ncbi:MAG: HAMP domain-containing protein [Desulfatibacillaceae bacterium]
MRTYTLQRTMIVYFLLIGAASLLVGVEFVADTTGADLEQQLVAGARAYAAGNAAEADLLQPLRTLRNKAMLMVGIILAVMVIVLTMFIKNITEPLQHVIEVSRDISNGDLSRTVRVRSDNELAELGNVINEMSTNLQEITWLSSNMCHACYQTISRVREILGEGECGPDAPERVRDEMAGLEEEVDQLAEVIEYFRFYKVDQ